MRDVKRFLQTHDLGVESLQVFGYLENTLLPIFYSLLYFR